MPAAQQTTNQPFLLFENEKKRVDLIDCSWLPKRMNEWNDFALVVLAFGGLWPLPAAGAPPKEREQQHKAKEWNGFTSRGDCAI